MPDTAVVSPSLREAFEGGKAAPPTPSPSPLPQGEGWLHRLALPRAACCVRPAFASSPRSTPQQLAEASAAALAMFLWWSTAGLLDRQTVGGDRGGRAELHRARYDEAGLPALVLTIEDRLTQDVEDDAIYLLVGPQGQRIAGNLQHWPQGAVRNGDWCMSCRSSVPECVRWRWCRALELQGGLHLLIGRDVRVRAQLRSLLTDALLWALLVVLVMATGGALVVRSLFRRALGNVSATAAAISAGDFTQRVKLSGRGDEFDQLAETINDILDRMARLMVGVREVSNAIAHDLVDANHPRAPGWRTPRRTQRRPRNCAPPSSGRPLTSTASSPCSRRCCASPR